MAASLQLTKIQMPLCKGLAERGCIHLLAVCSQPGCFSFARFFEPNSNVCLGTGTCRGCMSAGKEAACFTRTMAAAPSSPPNSKRGDGWRFRERRWPFAPRSNISVPDIDSVAPPLNRRPPLFLKRCCPQLLIKQIL